MGEKTRQEREKQKHTWVREEGKMTLTEAIKDLAFSSRSWPLHLCVIMAGQGSDLITVLYLAN